MAKKVSGKKHLEVKVDRRESGHACWSFCENGWQTTSIYVSKKMFEMMREMVTDKDVVEFYESIGGGSNGS